MWILQISHLEWFSKWLHRWNNLEAYRWAIALGHVTAVCCVICYSMRAHDLCIDLLVRLVVFVCVFACLLVRISYRNLFVGARNIMQNIESESVFLVSYKCNRFLIFLTIFSESSKSSLCTLHCFIKYNQVWSTTNLIMY